jgi:4-hydroxy-tetrahydrodipicolinate reductase
MIRLGVAGAMGRMGSSILRLAAQNKKVFEPTLALESSGNAGVGRNVSEANALLTGLGLGQMIVKSAPHADWTQLDVLIDFTAPAATLEHARLCSKHGIGLVIGTTGFTRQEKAKVQAAAKNIPIVMASNMSVGANLLFALAAQAARVLSSEYDIEIVEAHHRHKKDAPSGTAVSLAESIADAKGWKLESCAVYGRQGMTGERPKNQIGIHAVRAGEIIGEHTAYFSGPGETVELKHHAASRDAFAQGALVAAQFVSKKKKGLFNMQDVLGMNR